MSRGASLRHEKNPWWRQPSRRPFTDAAGFRVRWMTRRRAFGKTLASSGRRKALRGVLATKVPAAASVDEARRHGRGSTNGAISTTGSDVGPATQGASGKARDTAAAG